MRRLARHLFTFASAASLVLCVAVGVLWVRTADMSGRVRHNYPSVCIYVTSDSGRLTVGTDERLQWNNPNRSGMDQGEDWSPLPAWWDQEDVPRAWDLYRGSVRITHKGDILGTFKVNWVTVPHWALAATTFVLPFVWTVTTYRRVRRRVPGLCPQCGYDLRASPGRCPECGAEVRRQESGVRSQL